MTHCCSLSQSITYARHVGVVDSRIWLPCLVVRGRMLRARRMWHTNEMDMEHFANLSSVWLLQNADFQGLRCETELICVQSLSQP